MPTEEKNIVQNEPPKIGWGVAFTLIILGFIFFRGIYSLEVKSRSLGALVLPANADVPVSEGELEESEDDSEGCEAEAESDAECEAEAEGEGEGEGEGEDEA